MKISGHECAESEDGDGRESEQVDPKPTAGEEGFLDFEPHDGGDLG
jgi:hypothetical protein